MEESRREDGEKKQRDVRRWKLQALVREQKFDLTDIRQRHFVPNSQTSNDASSFLNKVLWM